MKVIPDCLSMAEPAPPCALTIGSFDGVHLGHRRLIEVLTAKAAERNLIPAVMTLRPHPRCFFFPDEPPFLLTAPEQQERLLRKAGIERLYILPFNARTAAMDRETFFRLLVDLCRARTLVVGHDFRFGRNAEGNYEYLRDAAAREGVETTQVDALVIGGQTVSSSLVRELVLTGQMEQVPRFLGRPFSLYGTVVSGKGLGTRIGYPTANVRAPHAILPAHGVYAASVRLPSGGLWPAAVNIGIAPTLGGNPPTVEAYLLDYTGDLRGESLEVFFYHRLRPEFRFPSVEELVKAIDADVQTVYRYFSEYPDLLSNDF